MRNPERYPFVAADTMLGEASLRPYLPLTLIYRDKSVPMAGLLDTGATVNVLPYQIGVQLGGEWEQQTTHLRLTGNLAQVEARALVVSATVAQFEPVRLVFAWTQATDIPLLLGQINFFMEFDVFSIVLNLHLKCNLKKWLPEPLTHFEHTVARSSHLLNNAN